MRYLFISLIILSLFFSCSKDEIETYAAERFLYFNQGISDSIVESFFFYPDQETVEIPFEILFAGVPTQEALSYRIEVDEEYTTAVRNTDFVFDSDRIWPQGWEKDTLTVTFKKTPSLDNKTVCVVLKVVSNAHFEAGPRDQARSARILVTSMAIRPTWWDSRITTYYLGNYTENKYAEFIRITGISDMSDMGATEIRYYSLMLKYHLIEMKNAGTPVLDEDGSEMSIPVVG